MDQNEVVRRTARRMGLSVREVESFLDIYSDEYVKVARDARVREPLSVRPITTAETNAPASAMVSAQAATSEAQAEAEAQGNPT